MKMRIALVITLAFLVAIVLTGCLPSKTKSEATSQPKPADKPTAIKLNTIMTVAGNGTVGNSGDGGIATSAEFQFPMGVAVSPTGTLYFSDHNHGCIRKVEASGTISTVAGGGTGTADGGPATLARLFGPLGVAVDPKGNLFITQKDVSFISKVDTGGTITRVAGNGKAGYSGDGSPALSAELQYPSDVAVDEAGDLFISDSENNRIRKVDSSGIITTIAGNGERGYFGDKGAATSAVLHDPTGLALDTTGNLFFSDSLNNRVRKVDKTGVIATIAGNGTAGYSGDGGPATAAELKGPNGLVVDSSGNLFIADTDNNRVRKVSTDGTISTVCGIGTKNFSGDGGLATAAELAAPNAVALDSAGNLFIADTENRRVRAVVSADSTLLAAIATETAKASQSSTGQSSADSERYLVIEVEAIGITETLWFDSKESRIVRVSDSLGGDVVGADNVKEKGWTVVGGNFVSSRTSVMQRIRGQGQGFTLINLYPNNRAVISTNVGDSEGTWSIKSKELTYQ